MSRKVITKQGEKQIGLNYPLHCLIPFETVFKYSEFYTRFSLYFMQNNLGVSRYMLHYHCEMYFMFLVVRGVIYKFGPDDSKKFRYKQGLEIPKFEN